MKKSLAISLAIAMLATLGVSGAAQAAAVKAGAPCLKAGITKTVSTTKFTCVKVGKKTIWNKGVKIVAKPIASPTPISSLRPSETAAPGTALQPLTYGNLLASSVVNNVAFATNKVKSEAGKSATVIKLSTGPKLPPTQVQPHLSAVQRMLDVLRPTYEPSAVYVNLFAWQDFDWVDQAISNSGGNPRATQDGSSYSEIMKTFQTCRAANGAVGRLGPVMNQCISDTMPAWITLETSTHELFHTFQMTVGGNNVPVWLLEGGANLAGTYFSASTYPEIFLNRRETLFRYFTRETDNDFRVAVRDGNQNEIVARFKALEGPNAPSAIRNSSYLLGELASEVLIAVDGWDKWVALHTGLKSKSFAENFKEVYGITLDQFYPIAAKYVLSQKP